MERYEQIWGVFNVCSLFTVNNFKQSIINRFFGKQFFMLLNDGKYCMEFKDKTSINVVNLEK